MSSVESANVGRIDNSMPQVGELKITSHWEGRKISFSWGGANYVATMPCDVTQEKIEHFIEVLKFTMENAQKEAKEGRLDLDKGFTASLIKGDAGERTSIRFGDSSDPYYLTDKVESAFQHVFSFHSLIVEEKKAEEEEQEPQATPSNLNPHPVNPQDIEKRDDGIEAEQSGQRRKSYPTPERSVEEIIVSNRNEIMEVFDSVSMD